MGRGTANCVLQVPQMIPVLTFETHDVQVLEQMPLVTKTVSNNSRGGGGNNICKTCSAGKEPTCNIRDLGPIPGLGRSPGEGEGWLPTPVFWPGEFYGLV